MTRLTLALDVMGGDIGPRITIPASLLALENDPELSLILFGDSQQIFPLLNNCSQPVLEREYKFNIAQVLSKIIKAYLMRCVIVKEHQCV